MQFHQEKWLPTETRSLFQPCADEATAATEKETVREKDREKWEDNSKANPTGYMDHVT